MTDPAPTRLLLADDHALFRRGLRTVLEQHGLEVVGEASNGQAAVRLAGELAPDVVVMDLHMPLMDGVQATRRIIAAHPRIRVLVLTISAVDAEVLEAIVAGAAGYLVKDAAVEDIVAGIRAAVDGGTMISPAVATALVARVREHAAAPPRPLPDLTDREVEVLRLLADGGDNAQIAAALHLSPSTVKNHVSVILDKLGVDSRVQAAVLAVRSGLA